jgi:hypothetical protein
MAKRDTVGWVNDMRGHPRIEGNLEISRSGTGIFIGGDPDALRSLAKLLDWVADVDQDSLRLQPVGERFHVHLRARDAPGFNSLTPFSCETEICRLDAKVTGELPERYRRRAARGQIHARADENLAKRRRSVPRPKRRRATAKKKKS